MLSSGGASLNLDLPGSDAAVGASRRYDDTMQGFTTPALNAVAEQQQEDYNELVEANVEAQKPAEQEKVRKALKYTKTEKREIVQKFDEDRVLQKVRERIERAGIPPTSVTVKFRNVTIDTEVFVGNRSLPTLTNVARGTVEDLLEKFKRGNNANKRKFVLLNDVSGCLQGGRCTLLLGPPGAGKSTLMRYLTGQLKDDSLRVSRGHFTYNGKVASEFHIERSSAYIDQEDKHVAELTVRETLEFSQTCQGAGPHKYLQEMLAAAERDLGVEPDPETKLFMDLITKQSKHNIIVSTIIKILGLDVCEDTLIGNELLKGISGGQRKRVTTGEMIVGPIKVLLMDEISTGLDSATTFSISQSLCRLCHYLNATILVALLQPTPETFELFDDLMLMSDGRIIYHGPLKDTLPFFKTMCFECPQRKPVADFVQEVTSKKDQQQYWAGTTPWEYVNSASFAAHFQESKWGKEEMEKLGAPDHPSDVDMVALWDKKYSLPDRLLLYRLLGREWILLKRTKVFLIAKMVQIGIMSFVVATTFIHWEIESELDGITYIGVAFLSVLNMYLGGMAELPLVCNMLPVFYRQRDSRFYPSWAWGVATTLIKQPQVFGEALLWTLVMYFALPYTITAGQFFMFLAIMIITNVTSVIMFRTIACYARDETLAQACGAVLLVLSINTSGFIIARTDIRPYLIWLYWISPMAWGLRGMSVNELLSKRWGQPALFFPGENMGIAALKLKGFQTEYFWAWLALAYLAGTAVFCMLLQFIALKWLRRPKEATSLSEDQLNQDSEENTKIFIPPAPRNSITLGGLVGKGSVPPGPAVEVIVSAGAAAGETAPLSPIRSDSMAGDRGQTLSMVATGASNVTTPSQDASRQVDPAGTAQTTEQKSRLPFTPLNMVFKQIVYTVQLPGGKPGEQLTLLNGISGLFRPGVLTALMGASGAGKTTLMDVLAGRKTGGVINGDVLVNGYKKVQATFNRIMGYVEQFDVHAPCATIHEALLFSARMRLEGVTLSVIKEFVDEVMELVELVPLRSAVIGLPGRGGLSVEQRKRLTIAVELVANPSIVFMDEPTSGLDARAAAIVMRVVRNTVNTGRTVVCTIHQPSLDIFEAFDELLLLKRGGKTIFFGNMGPQQATLIGHFESVQGVAPFKPGGNPANWMLEVASPNAEKNMGIDFSEIYDKSPLAQGTKDLIEQLSSPAAGISDISFKGVHALGQWQQFIVLLGRFNTTYWRTPNYNLVRMVTTVFYAFFYGALFWDRGMERGTFDGISNVMGALYASTCFLSVSNAMVVLPVIQNERAVFYRERASGYYSEMPYGQAQGLIELPYVTVQTVVFSIILYWMVGFQASAAKFFLFVLYFWLLLIFFTFFGMVAILITPAVQFGTVLVAFAMGFWNLFCGFLIQQPVIPGYWIWVYWTNPIQYAIYGLVCSQLCDITDTEVLINPNEPSTSLGNVQQYLKNEMGYQKSFLGWIVLILIGFIFAARVVAQWALVKLNFQNR